MALQTVGDIVAQIRVLVQDTDAALYRYSDASVYQALNGGMLETRRVRPDFFRGVHPTPQYATPADSGTDIYYPEEYVPSLIDYVCGIVQLRDAEDTTDARAGAFITAFRHALSAG